MAGSWRGVPTRPGSDGHQRMGGALRHGQTPTRHKPPPQQTRTRLNTSRQPPTAQQGISQGNS